MMNILESHRMILNVRVGIPLIRRQAELSSDWNNDKWQADCPYTNDCSQHHCRFTVDEIANVPHVKNEGLITVAAIAGPTGSQGLHRKSRWPTDVGTSTRPLGVQHRSAPH